MRFQFEASSNGNANNKVVFNSKDKLSFAQISELLRFVKNVKFSVWNECKLEWGMVLSDVTIGVK